VKYSYFCGDKQLKRSIDYLNSLRSIEYLINSYSDLTFFKSTSLNEKQIKALSLLPIKPLELDENHKNQVEEVKTYFTELEDKQSEKDIFDNFFNTNFKV
jgi:hypothetical protein